MNSQRLKIATELLAGLLASAVAQEDGETRFIWFNGEVDRPPMGYQWNWEKAPTDLARLALEAADALLAAAKEKP